MASSGLTLFTVIFFFQAEDGIRDYKVTGVQTCALPISLAGGCRRHGLAASQPGCHGHFTSVRPIHRDLAWCPDRSRAAPGNVGRAFSQTDPAALSRADALRGSSRHRQLGETPPEACRRRGVAPE